MKNYRSLATLFIVVTSLVAVYWAIASSYMPELSERGLFGDSFGGLTSLFSGLAFAGMIYAIILQSNELKLQREELALTRKELTASRKEQAKSAKAQNALVKQQVLAAKISGLSALVQSRYQYAAAHGANAPLHLHQVKDVERLLLKTMEESGLGKIDLPPIK